MNENVYEYIIGKGDYQGGTESRWKRRSKLECQELNDDHGFGKFLISLRYLQLQYFSYGNINIFVSEEKRIIIHCNVQIM